MKDRLGETQKWRGVSVPSWCQGPEFLKVKLRKGVSDLIVNMSSSDYKLVAGCYPNAVPKEGSECG